MKKINKDLIKEKDDFIFGKVIVSEYELDYLQKILNLQQQQIDTTYPIYICSFNSFFSKRTKKHFNDKFFHSIKEITFKEIKHFNLMLENDKLFNEKMKRIDNMQNFLNKILFIFILFSLSIVFYKTISF